ncbi:MAG: CTP synthase [Gammaproteobacteria bacterium]|jgi:CTP synthase|nr:CTP synthase [Gammaproteobacteria bacterium]MBT4462122.1 CTP synthase [Gammaproteobacteria bacterium]MBT4654981.1 CTP synthase [Gammaproteobacteria bacterium]MBT5116505.1 CTP synthase [Gammaproteobacteria bacterium]MBT5761534.1 CTP synthase [Gammaproteobacteria bacterium]
MTRYVFITGGVVSSLGKGIAAASLASLFKLRGFKVSLQKLDPYINLDPGTMSPIQHGEVFVTDDGAETDLDLGHYERFVGIRMTQDSNVTAGRVYSNVINKERKGEYLGSTVQVIPHITDEIKKLIIRGAKNSDIAFVEIGGTVGDIESLPFLESIRQFSLELGKSRSMFVHLTLLPYIEVTNEIKTKPTQHSVKDLRSIGIQPDILLCRGKNAINQRLKKKLALFTNVPEKAVFSAVDAKSIYDIPILFREQKIDEFMSKQFKLKTKRLNLSPWNNYRLKASKCKKIVKIAMIGKYVDLADSYKSLNEALYHAGIINNRIVEITYLDSEKITKKTVKKLSKMDGILVPGGFGNRGIEGKVLAAEYARVNNVPYLGICLGMQISVIEFARNVLKLKNANSTEFNNKTRHPVVALVNEWRDSSGKKIISDKKNMGGTMRLGSQGCALEKKSLAYKMYKKSVINERHRHRYEVNNGLIELFDASGLVFSGKSKKGNLMEIIELKSHPWYVGCQFHPEFTSSPISGHPLFNGFIAASAKNRK